MELYGDARSEPRAPEEMLAVASGLHGVMEMKINPWLRPFTEHTKTP